MRHFSRLSSAARRGTGRAAHGDGWAARHLALEPLESRLALSGVSPLGVSGLEDGLITGPEPTLAVDPPAERSPLAAELATADAITAAASYSLDETFLLHSNPGASKTIFLDFDGHTTTGTYWNNYNDGQAIVSPAYDIDGNASSFSSTELTRIQGIWERVAEDYLPLDVNVTTEDPGSAALSKSWGTDNQWGIRVVIGGNGDWFGSAGGVAYVGSFTWSSDTPCFVFEDNLGNGYEKYVAEAATHEVGHTLGLYHDGGGGDGEYYGGHGSGATGWAPIMGVGYYRQLVQWSQGEYPDANQFEDDLAIITTENGFGYRADDHGGGRSTATDLGGDQSLALAGEGIIERRSDLDYFRFSTGSGLVEIDIDPFYRSPNLDILAQLHDAAGNLLAQSNPFSELSAGFSLSLEAGTYYLSVDGTGKAASGSDYGYTDYGSLGYYSISGTVAAPNQAPTDVTLQPNSVDENVPLGTAVGTLTASDPDAGDSHTYALVAGSGDQDNAHFIIDGDQLRTAATIDYESQTTFGIRVRATDAGGLWYEKSLTVTVNDLAEAPSGPVAHWSFDAGSGTLAADTSTAGGDNSAPIRGGATWTDYGLGGALRFDGVDDYVDVADTIDINLATYTERTISAWFYVDDAALTDRKQVIYEEGGTYRGLNIYIDSGQLYVGGWNIPERESGWSGTFLSTNEITSGRWHHVALVLNGGTAISDGALTGYLDGVAFGSGAGSQLWSHSGDIGIGRTDGLAEGVAHLTKFHDGDASDADDAFAGMLDEVRVHNRTLSSEEIANLAARTLTAPPNDPVAHWSFDAGSGTLAADTSTAGGDNSAPIRGGATWTDYGLGGALRFDGVDDYVDVADTIDINLGTYTERTVSAWFYVDDAALTDRKQVVYEEGGISRGLNIYIDSGQLYVGGWNIPERESGWSGMFLSTNEITSGQWHHVALVLNGGPTISDGALTGYLDGVAFGSGAGSQLWSHSGDIGIGRTDGLAEGLDHLTKFHDGDASDADDAFAGMLDEIRVHNRALSSEEIANLAARTLTAPPNDPVAHWSFDAGSGTLAADTSTAGGDNSAPIRGGATWTDYGLGGALRFDGVDDYVDVADTIDINLGTYTERTISAWFYVDDAALTDRKQVIFEEGGTYRGLNIYIDSGQLYVGGWNIPERESGWSGTFLSTNEITSGQWYHVALVLNGGPTVSDGALTGYLDGVAFGSGAGSQLWSHSGDIGIGRTDGLAEGLDHLTKFHDGDASDADDAFAGMLDEIRVHNRALSSEEIANLAAEDLIAPPSSASPLSAAADVFFAEGAPISEQEQLSASTSASPSPTPIPSPASFQAQSAETAFGRRGLPRWVFADNLAGLLGRPW